MNRVFSHENSISDGVKNIKTEQVSVITLDEISSDHGSPSVIKIDVEGYEDNVFAGATQTLHDPMLKLLLVETVSPQLHKHLSQLGFSVIYYDPFKRSVSQTSNMSKSANKIYARDIDFIIQRLQTSPKYKLPNLNISI